MKIKFLFYTLVSAGLILLGTSCNKSFLIVQPIALSLESNYYQTPDQAFNGLVAIYDAVAPEAGYGINWYANKLGPLNSAADECYAGGGSSTDIQSWQDWNNNNLSAATGPSQMFWDMDYAGVYRANLLLSKLVNPIPGLSTDLQNRYVAEAKVLRAYFYFELERLFANIPLIVTPLSAADIYTVLQAKPADVYAQIEKDLTEAIPALPATVVTAEDGRITSGAANAMLGKVYLYEKKWSDAASTLNKVNNSGVYSLLPNYKDIFSPANKFNSESIFEIVHTNAQSSWWGPSDFRGNVYCTMVGPRSYSAGNGLEDKNHIYYSGWSFNPIIKAFAASMHSDPRYNATVTDLDSLVSIGQAAYQAGYMNTGLFEQKWCAQLQWLAPTGQDVLNWPNDVIEIRLADTYLMEAEASVQAGATARAQTLLDAVRARVGLPSIPATLNNIYEERRLELATEGHRWFDLVRTGRAATVLAFKGFKAGTNEILPIPLTSMNNTKLVQNPGYN